MYIDSNVKHTFTFTPSFSLFITCDSEEEINRLYENLTASGGVLMPLANHGFSKKFGVSWQLNLPN